MPDYQTIITKAQRAFIIENTGKEFDAPYGAQVVIEKAPLRYIEVRFANGRSARAWFVLEVESSRQVVFTQVDTATLRNTSISRSVLMQANAVFAAWIEREVPTPALTIANVLAAVVEGRAVRAPFIAGVEVQISLYEDGDESEKYCIEFISRFEGQSVHGGSQTRASWHSAAETLARMEEYAAPAEWRLYEWHTYQWCSLPQRIES